MTGVGLPVLVVEDDARMREWLAQLLTDHGYRVLCAATGEDAVAIARREPVQLVLLDVRLPGVSGYELCRQLRAEFDSRLRIIFISGERIEPFDRAVGLRLGGDDYLVKPISPDELLARMERLLERDPPRREPARAGSTNLTPRELQVLELLAEGQTPSEIAQTLGVSRKTIASHLQSILTKLYVHSQAQAVAAAFRRGLIPQSQGAFSETAL